MPSSDGALPSTDCDTSPSNSPSSSRQTDSSPPNERIVYSATPSPHRIVLNQQPAQAPAHSSSTSPDVLPSLVNDPSLPRRDPSLDPPTLPRTCPHSPLPHDLFALFHTDDAEKMKGFPFLRRSSSVTDLPVLSLSSQSALPNKFYQIPAASQSTSDLPNPPPLPRTPVIPRKGSNGAIGPKAGARLLASREALRSQRKADEMKDYGEEEFSIRRAVRLRADGGLSTVTPSVPSRSTSEVAPARPRQDTSSEEKGTRSGTNSKGTSVATSKVVRRVPVPTSTSTAAFPVKAKEREREKNGVVRKEASLSELTRKASEEDEDLDEEATRLRKASLSKASGAGLASPFSSRPSIVPATSSAAAVDSAKKRRAPPVSGLNKNVVDTNDPGQQRVPQPRQRTASADSRASVTKDGVLRELGDALKKERKKAEAYEEETRRIENELEEIQHNMDVMSEKMSTAISQQEQVIANLEAEIDELRSELEVANDLDEATAREYLDLLTAPSHDDLKSRPPVVTTFDPSALTSSSPKDTNSSLPTFPTAQKGKFSALAIRRALSLKRRVDTHLKAYDTVNSSSVAVPKPPLRHHSLTTGDGGTIDDVFGGVRPRKLSKRHRTRSSSVLRGSSGERTTAESGVVPADPFSHLVASSSPAAVASSSRPPFLPSKSSKRPPPVSGVSRGGAGRGGLLTGTSQATGEEFPPRPKGERKRTNSLTKTLRILFPSQAPKKPRQPVQELPPAFQPSWLRSH